MSGRVHRGDRSRLVVNGRFLRRPPTGLHRVARSLLDAARLQGLDAEVIAPAGVTDARVDRNTWSPPGRPGDHFWEQVVLPSTAGRHPVLSLANTAPVLPRRAAVMVHDLAPLVNPSWFRPAMRFYARMALAAARRAEVVLTVSEQVASELEHARVPRARIRVIRNAVDRRFRPATPAQVLWVRQRHRLGGQYVVMVGWADPRKDAATAVNAHRAVVGELPHDLVLVGHADRNFAEVQTPQGLSLRVLGHVPDDELVALLSGAAALLYPSRYEGFGLPPLEAVACGTPALASDLPAVREATEGRAVLLPPGDIDAWAEGLRRSLEGDVPCPDPPSWTWGDAAALLLDALGPLRDRSS